MAKNVVVFASGRTELRALPNLLRGLASEGVSVDVRIPPRNRAISGELAVKIAKSCYWDVPSPDKLVILVDVDGKNPDEVLESLRQRVGSALDHLDLRIYYAYAQRHLEAWFFADAKGLREYLGSNLGSVDASRPDLIENPKLHLKHLLANQLYTSEVAERISRVLDAEEIAERSASFGGFLGAVRNGIPRPPDSQEHLPGTPAGK